MKDLKRKPGQGANLYNLSLGGLIIIGGLVWSLPGSTTGNLEIEQSVPAPVTPAAPPAPVKATAPVPVPSAPAPKPAASKLSAPTIAPVSSQPAQIRQGLQKNSYIDAAPQGTAAAPNLPTRTEVEFIPRSGQQAPLNTRYPAANRSATNRAPVARQQSSPVNPPKAIAPRRQSINARNAAPGNNSVSPLNPLNIQPKISSLAIGQPVGSNQVFSLDPMANRGIQIALAPLPEYSRATGLYSPQGQPGQGTDMMFPVAGVNPITSAFGWRIHPISGQGRMHNGTDIGAPMGTPVLAAYDGIVAAAQWSGGYGLMVTLRHLDGTQESRYAHLSEAFVQTGQEVARGEVIGRVGSTGFSTGPHLHFEWRHLTNDGWVAVDAGPHLEAALANLMAAQKYAQSQADSQPQS